MRFTISNADWDEQRRRLFFDELEARARALPGITNAALAMSVPIDGSYCGSVFILNDRLRLPRATCRAAHSLP